MDYNSGLIKKRYNEIAELEDEAERVFPVLLVISKRFFFELYMNSG